MSRAKESFRQLSGVDKWGLSMYPDGQTQVLSSSNGVSLCVYLLIIAQSDLSSSLIPVSSARANAALTEFSLFFVVRFADIAVLKVPQVSSVRSGSTRIFACWFQVSTASYVIGGNLRNRVHQGRCSLNLADSTTLEHHVSWESVSLNDIRDPH